MANHCFNCDPGTFQPGKRIFTTKDGKCPRCGRQVREVEPQPPKPRTCYDCARQYPCLMYDAINNFPSRWLRIGPEEEGGAPLRRVDLYTTLAGCCLLFEGRKE